MAARAYTDPATERAYERAVELCRGIGDAPQLSQALLGLATFYLVRGQLDTASEVGQALNETLGANPYVVDAEQNRPAAFAELSRNLQLFGPNRLVVFSGPAELVAIHRWSPLRREIEVAGSAPFTVGLRILDYPYWSVSTDEPNQVQPGGLAGVVAGRLPAGRHRIHVTWDGNPLAAVGLMVAAGTALVLVFARRRSRGAVLGEI